MENLNDYYKAFFDEAKMYERIRSYLHGLILILMGLSVISKSYTLYAIALIGVVSEFAAWYFKFQSKQNESLAHNLQRITMLIEAYGQGSDTHNFDISHLIGEASKRVHNRAKEKASIFRLTKQSLKHLKNTRVPDKILEALKQLRNQGFRKENDFMSAVEEKIGKEQADTYKKSLVQYAKKPYQNTGVIWLWLQKKLEDRKKKLNEGANYNFPKDVKGAKKLCYMMQENAYWNHHLYENCSQHGFRKFFGILGIIIFLLLLIIPILSADINYSIPRIGLIVLSFVMVYENLDRALIWRSSSKMMLAIDNHLQHVNSKTEDIVEDFVMLMYSNYNITKLITPTIPNSLYKAHKEKLNIGWAERIKQMSQN